MPFGLKNAGPTFQRFIDSIFVNSKNTFIYLDDILIASESEDEHIADVTNALSFLAQHNLHLSLDKCAFLQSSLTFLGYEVSASGVRPPADRVAVITESTLPKNSHELRRLMEYITAVEYIKGHNNIFADCLSRQVCATTVDVFDLHKLASAQADDNEMLSNQDRLILYEIAPNLTLWCDTSTSSPKPFVPSTSREPDFTALHRTLKTAIMAREQNWFHSLPIVFLGLRMTPNAAGFSPFTAVTGTMMLCLQPVISRNIHKTTSPELLQTFMSEMQSIDFRQCSEGTCHSSPPSYVPPDLQTCDKVSMRVDRVRKSPEAPYTGPCEVLRRSPKTFTLKLPQGDTTVSIDRLKPTYVSPTIKQLHNPSVSPANPSVSPANPSVSPANPSVSPATPSVSPAIPSVSPATPSVSPPTATHFNSSPPVLPPAAPSSPSETARSPSSTRTRSGRTVRFKSLPDFYYFPNSGTPRFWRGTPVGPLKYRDYFSIK
ncbi:Reverse transcriptase domain [Trinorchestia longiramus]|nr:Reverse transcriptase domain [Trinorchestia longiramus]